MNRVKAKKRFGQHFLNDENIARKIVDAFVRENPCLNVLEVGPGTGILTKYLLREKNLNLHVIEIDPEFVTYMQQHFPLIQDRIITGDVLNFRFAEHFNEPFAIIGNFPYNISSQILFRVYEYRNVIPYITGMFQKEVADRICSMPGKKTYGILSVLMQAFYNIEYLFSVSNAAFHPSPKVTSAVLRFARNNTASLGCDEKLFVTTVKAGFNQRRKMLGNAIKGIMPQQGTKKHPLLSKRAEQLSVAEFVELTNMADKS